MSPAADWGLLILRLAVGLVFAMHGVQKVFGEREDADISGGRAAIASTRVSPARPRALLSALAELTAGMLLAIGLLTPLAAMLVARSVVFIFAARWARGFFDANGGYEFPLALAAGTVAVLLAGPGDWSLDAALNIGLPTEVRVALLIIGILAGLGVLALRPRT